jgi:hypothetical protein
MNVPGPEDWIKASEEDAKKRHCDAIGCGKVEENELEWKICSRCR